MFLCSWYCTMTDQAAIDITNLVRTFGTTRAVDGLTLKAPRGHIFGLVGPDGAGKTTTIRILCGSIRAHGGRALVGGIDVAERPEDVRRHLGYVAQRFSLYGDLTVRENMTFLADIYQVPQHERPALIKRLLEFSRLTPFQNRRADALSGGMKQKLALACALVHRPEILLLDEPTTGVDPVSRREFWDILRDAVVKDGVTVLMTTPYMDEAERCHQVGFMRNGKLLASGTPHELQALVQGVVLEVLVTPARVAEHLLRTAPGVRDVQLFGDRLHLVADTMLSESFVREQLGTQAQLQGIRRVQPTMEDIFMQLQSGKVAS